MVGAGRAVTGFDRAWPGKTGETKLGGPHDWTGPCSLEHMQAASCAMLCRTSQTWVLRDQTESPQGDKAHNEFTIMSKGRAIQPVKKKKLC